MRVRVQWQVGAPGALTNAQLMRMGYDRMGWPKFLEITRTKWKGKKGSDPSITQMLHANVVEEEGGEYCSVAAVLFLMRYYSLEGVQDGPLFRQFVKDKKSGKKVPQKANFEKKDCKVGSGTATCSKWYAEKDEMRDRAGELLRDGEGQVKMSWRGAASLSEDAVRAQLMKFFKSAAAQALVEGREDKNPQAAVHLAAATPHTFRATMVG